jgi:hypothetical protein
LGVRVNRNLAAKLYQVDFVKCGAAGKVVGVNLHERDWVAVWDGATVKGSVFSTGPPYAVLLG